MVNLICDIFICDLPVKIMPLGNSITYDDYTNDPRPAGERTGYRSHLWYSLIDAGYNVDFVGSVEAGQDIEPAFDPYNEGHPGWTDEDIADEVYQFLESNPADIVLLHIGTNDIDTSSDDTEDILDNIDQYEMDYGTDVTVILARIINRRNHVCPSGSTTTTFNNNVEAMALERIENGDKIIIVDMECDAGIDYSTEMVDNLHPTDAGYQKMATIWLQALEDLLPVCNVAAPSIISTPKTEATVGFLYSYDVSAIGNPAPTFALTGDVPSDAIDEDTGMIRWTPLSAGDYQVTVSATNSEGSDLQPFTISVGEAACPSDMISYWKLDETSGGTYLDVYDSNHGTCAGDCPLPISGLISGGQSFHSTTGIDIPPDPSFSWGHDQSFSIGYWIRRQATVSGVEVVVGRDDSSSNLHWWSGLRSDGTAAFVLLDTNGNGGGLLGGSKVLTDGLWHNIVVVRDAQNN